MGGNGEPADGAAPEFVFNGVNGADGDYLLTAAAPEELLPRIEPLSARDAAESAYLHDRATRQLGAVRDGVDPHDLAEAGWGVIFPDGPDAETAALAEALRPLLDLRRAQASRQEERRYREYRGESGCRPGETGREFRRRHGIPFAAADPDEMPYYLLVVGPPDRIPFRFQAELDVQRALGRLWFPALEDYAEYARRVVEAERAPRQASRLAFFGPRNPDDRATELSASELLVPLAAGMKAAGAGWTVASHVGEEATRERLAGLFADGARPDILFTASHGLGFPPGDPRQSRRQGALLCQDWPGPRLHRGPIPEEFCFGADDVGGALSAAGLIAFHFACYSAGTPRLDDFAGLGARSALAPAAFLSALPIELLRAGALAAIGHVDRAWSCSFHGRRAGRHTATYEDILKRLMAGAPVGWAMEPLNGRYAELAAQLSEELQDRAHGDPVDLRALVALWTESNDARNYMVLGDPAVRLAKAASLP